MLRKKQGWKVVATGECMPVRAIKEYSEPGFLKLREIMERADVCYGHLEMNFGSFHDLSPARGGRSDRFVLADPLLAKDLRWFGMDIVSLANDHSFDFGPKGVESTLRTCYGAEIACAGTGRDLDEARAPGYWEGTAGRVALISCASGNTANEWANLSKANMRTRSGHNPMRVRVRYRVPADIGETLREMGKNLSVIRKHKPGSRSGDIEEGEFRIMLPSEQSTNGAFGTVSVFKDDEGYGVDSFCHRGDLEGNLRSIEDATKVADLVMVAHHFNIAETVRGDTPPHFAVEYAHAAIDAGADVYFGYGWNKTLGVEIYKGKPIFYGLGNFFEQSAFVARIPYDNYEASGMDMDRFTNFRPGDKPGNVNADGLSLTSIMVELEYAPDKKIQTITFYPVELGVNVEAGAFVVTRRTGAFAEGRPMLATGICAQKILGRVKDLSVAYGTKITIEGDIGRWEAETI